jgi:hypothetical protein
MVRSRGLEPPRVAPLAPQASASTSSATTALGMTPDLVRRRGNGGGCNKSAMTVQGRSSAAADDAQEVLAIARERPI